MNLSEFVRACLAGDLDKASQFAMSILVRIGEIQDAEEMLDITRAHNDSTLFQGDATPEFAERLVHMGAQVGVPPTRTEQRPAGEQERARGSRGHEQ